MILEARGILDTAKIEKLTERFRDYVDIRGNRDIMKLMRGASLAHHRLLISVDTVWLYNVDLSPVPAQHLASLASCVTSYLRIENVSGCDLASLLTSLKCLILNITRQSLGREDTQALVQAMESGVEYVVLCEDVELDIEALAEYSGQGRCSKVELDDKNTTARYEVELRTWAGSRNWTVRVHLERLKNGVLLYCASRLRMLG